jgi:hypothetical protein
LIELGTVGLSAATAEEAHPKEPDTQQADRSRLRNSRDIGGRCNPTDEKMRLQRLTGCVVLSGSKSIRWCRASTGVSRMPNSPLVTA